MDKDTFQSCHTHEKGHTFSYNSTPQKTRSPPWELSEGKINARAHARSSLSKSDLKYHTDSGEQATAVAWQRAMLGTGNHGRGRGLDGEFQTNHYTQ